MFYILRKRCCVCDSYDTYFLRARLHKRQSIITTQNKITDALSNKLYSVVHWVELSLSNSFVIPCSQESETPSRTYLFSMKLTKDVFIKRVIIFTTDFERVSTINGHFLTCQPRPFTTEPCLNNVV